MDMIDKNIAYNLKKIRKGQNLSLDMLAEKTGVSKSMLGQIERGESNPTITTIAKICEGLRISLENLIYKEKDSVIVVYKKQCRVTKKQEGKYQVRLVFPFEKDRSFEIYQVEIEKDAGFYTTAYGMHTVEYVMLTKGKAELKYADEKYELEEGDSLRLNANQEYYLVNSGSDILNLSVVLTVE